MGARSYGVWFVSIGVAIACGKSQSHHPRLLHGDAGDGGESGESSGGSAGAVTGGSSSKGGSAGSSSGAGGDGMAGEPSGGAGDGGEGGIAGTCTATDPVVITSEADLREFAARGCEALEGSLWIRASTLTNLDELGRVGTLRGITGDLLVDQSPMLANLRGFASLEEIGGSLVLTGSDVEDLAGLDTLRLVGSDTSLNTLVITENARLVSVAALGSVESLRAGLVVSGNPELASLVGIRRLTAASNVSITSNERLTEIAGLVDLERAEQLTVAANPRLASATFPQLADAGSATFTSNDVLGAVSLPSLAHIESFTIAGNPVLTTLGTLDALEDVGLLIIAGNPRLPQCFVDALDSRLGGACNMSCGGNDPSAVCN